MCHICDLLICVFFIEIIINTQQDTYYLYKKWILLYCLGKLCKPTFYSRGFLSISTLQHLNTFSCQFIGLRSVVFFFPPEKLYSALSRELKLCNHCPVSASAFLCLCFLLVLELTASQRRMGFEPGGSSLYQRLIATSEQGTAPKQTFTVVKRGSAPNDVGQRGLFTAQPLWRRMPEMDKYHDISCQQHQKGPDPVIL